MLSLACFPQIPRDFPRRNDENRTCVRGNGRRFIDVMNSRGDSLRLLDVLCVPFPVLPLYVEHKPYLNLAISAQKKLAAFLRKNHVDETLVTHLFAETRGNLAREMQKRLRRWEKPR